MGRGLAAKWSNLFTQAGGEGGLKGPQLTPYLKEDTNGKKFTIHNFYIAAHLKQKQLEIIKNQNISMSYLLLT